MDVDSTELVILVLAALAGAFFTVVPIIPGALFIPAGAAVLATMQRWDEIPAWFWAVQVVLVVAYVLVDNLAQVVGVKRAGGSRAAMVGGAIGVFVGPIVLALVMGPFALLFGPPVGAVVGTLVGEERARSRLGDPSAAAPRNHVRLSIGALVAYAVSTALKLVLVAVQVGLFILVVS
jgi:uncharacterized protein YqgC (DUF456 family)